MSTISPTYFIFSLSTFLYFDTSIQPIPSVFFLLFFSFGLKPIRYGSASVKSFRMMANGFFILYD